MKAINALLSLFKQKESVKPVPKPRLDHSLGDACLGDERVLLASR